jgi:RHS repeat-associated protein
MTGVAADRGTARRRKVLLREVRFQLELAQASATALVPAAGALRSDNFGPNEISTGSVKHLALLRTEHVDRGSISAMRPGESSDCTEYPPTNGCQPISWPGWATTAWHDDAGKQPTTGYEHYWFGSQAVGMRDASGRMYMRNRYYDPATGRFTQPDPIGLAGALSSYGIAAGDTPGPGPCPPQRASVASRRVARGRPPAPHPLPHFRTSTFEPPLTP